MTHTTILGTRHPRWLALLTAALAVAALTSCGDMFEFQLDAIPSSTMELDQHVVDLMVGDRYVIPRHVAPDSTSNASIFWMSDDREVVELRADTLIAVGEGSAMATAITVSSQLEDSCLVNVWPRWYIRQTDYLYDTVIYADITLRGASVPDDIFVGAFIDDQLRGVAEPHVAQGIRYFALRIWSPYSYGEHVTLRLYDASRATMVRLPGDFVLDGEAHGTLSVLYPLHFMPAE